LNRNKPNPKSRGSHHVGGRTFARRQADLVSHALLIYLKVRTYPGEPGLH